MVLDDLPIIVRDGMVSVDLALHTYLIIVTLESTSV